jgi:hypothetical protein
VAILGECLGRVTTMAKPRGLEIDRRVGIALSVLQPLQKLAVERVTRSPQAFALAAAKPGRVHQMPTSGQPLYMMKLSSSLRLIYTMVGDTIYVVDVVENATLSYFARRKAGKKAAQANAKVASNAVKK